MSGFGGLQIGLSSLFAQRRAIEVAGHNIANVGTEGYSRQRVELASDAGPITPALFARYEGAGMGVRAGTITRMRDQFLELRGNQERAADSRLAHLRTAFERVESAFGEPSDTGLAAQLADFWAGWDDVANRPDDIAARSQLLERASTLAAGFRRLDEQFVSMREATVEQLTATVAEVNALAGRIAELNGTIQSAVLSGLNGNDLMDQRDLLVTRLAERVGATTRPNDAGSVDVFVGGTALVRGTSAESLQVTVGTDPAQTVTVSWAKDGLAATVDGSTAAMLEAVGQVLPDHRARLAAVADELRVETNGVHTTGFDLDGNPGLDVFVVGPLGLELNPALAGQPRMVAAAAAPGTLDGSVAARLAASGGADRAYRELVVGLGVQTQSAIRRADIQAAITQQVDAARESEAGVNLDEEMTNLIAYQHAYDAAARFVTAVDQALDTLINGTGLVGR